MAKPLKIYWTKLAEMDLENVFDSLRQQSPQAARKLIGKIRHNVAFLSEFPEMGRSFDLVQPPAREILVSHYQIFYDYIANEDRILILAIFDSRQDPNKIFSRLTRTHRS